MQDVFRHEALPYSGRASFVTSCVSLAREGLERDERVILLAQGEKLDDVRDELGLEADEITFVATDEHGRNPARITTMLHSFQAAGDGRHSLGINETVHIGRTPPAHVEAQLADSVLNDVSLRTWALSVVCLYDDSLDRPTLQAMQHNHAVVRGLERDEDFQPDLAATVYAGGLPPPPPQALRLAVSAPGLRAMRRWVRDSASGLGLAADRLDDLALAANEIVTNSLRHGGELARMAIWFADGAVVCEVVDRGHISGPLVGRFAPPPSATSGRGLWLANHLCDLVQIRSSSTGTTVRLHVDR